MYPPNVDPIGFIRKEAVYPRSCVYTLQGRENWFHKAKTVKVDAEPYKQVKARPKWDKVSFTQVFQYCTILRTNYLYPKVNHCIITGGTLDLFGEWQVEDYDPPTAKNGKVPRNEYGNVDLFLPRMIPKKCVHLKRKSLSIIDISFFSSNEFRISVPGLNRIARKLNIDCVAATVGFDFSTHGSHPISDGWVVCEEFEDTLRDAWKEVGKEFFISFSNRI